MRQEIPVEVQEQLVDTLCEVFYWKDSLRRYLSKIGLPQPVLDNVYLELRSRSKRPVLYELVDALLELPVDQGVPPLNTMLRQMSQWTAFRDVATSSANAQKIVGELARLIQKYDLDLSYSLQVQEAQSERLRKLIVLRDKYIAFSKPTENPQQRGRDLETLLRDLFELGGFCKLPRKRPFSSN